MNLLIREEHPSKIKLTWKNLKTRCIISLIPSEVSLPSLKSKNFVFETRENLGTMHACITDDYFIESSNIFLVERFPCIKSSCNITEVSFSKNLNCLIEREKIIFKIIDKNFKNSQNEIWFILTRFKLAWI